MPSDAKSASAADGVSAPSLVDRLNFHSSGSGGLFIPARAKSTATPRTSLSGVLCRTEKENVRQTPMSAAGASHTAVAASGRSKTPALFVPSPRPAPPSADKGKQKATMGDAHAGAEAGASKLASLVASSSARSKDSTVIILDSSSSSSEDDELPAVINGRSVAIGGGTGGMPRSSASRAAVRARRLDPCNGTSTPKAPASATRRNAPLSTASRSAARGSRAWNGSSAAEIIEITDESNELLAPVVSGTHAARRPSPSSASRTAGAAAPPSSADPFWDSLSASELEQLERGPSAAAGPSASTSAARASPSRPCASPAPSSSSSNLGIKRPAASSSRARPISIIDDDDDDEDAVMLSTPPRPAPSSSKVQTVPPAQKSTTYNDDDIDDAFLNFDDDDDELYAALEESANQSLSTFHAAPRQTASANSGAGMNPSAPLHSSPYGPPQHTPLSALPEDKRRQYLEQFGNPGGDDDDFDEDQAGRKQFTDQENGHEQGPSRYGAAGRGGSGRARGHQEEENEFDDLYGGGWESDEGGRGGVGRGGRGGAGAKRLKTAAYRKPSGSSARGGGRGFTTARKTSWRGRGRGRGGYGRGR
ncbi:hypothetical protein OC834_004818 [Tilletia horrida]|nr:hypothetical protein OC834_004818 [Tilletia horrida]KAK0566147.1 hypothetical protein OC844_000891 [Tilletia horrida]